MICDGYVYIIEDEKNICKIGCSKDFPDIRVKSICYEYKKNFVLLGILKSDHAYEDEQFIHNLLQEYRIKGEWFNLSYENIKEELIKFNMNFIDIDKVESIDRKWTIVNLRIPASMVCKIDSFIKKGGYGYYLSRTAWILRTLDNAIKKLGVQNERKN